MRLLVLGIFIIVADNAVLQAAFGARHQHEQRIRDEIHQAVFVYGKDAGGDRKRHQSREQNENLTDGVVGGVA